MIVIPPSCTDRRAEFAQRFDSIAETKNIDSHALLRRDFPNVSTKQPVHEKPESIEHEVGCTLVVPGLLGGSVRALVAPLLCARERLAVKGYDIDVAWVSGRSGCDHNAELLRRAVLDAAARTGDAVNLIGYSKGCADSLHMLANHPDTHEAVKSLTSYAGIVGGTSLATNVSKWVEKVLQLLPIPGEPFGDGRAIADLTIAYRQLWLSRFTLPEHIRLCSIAAAPLPERVSRVLKGTYQQLAQIDPDNDSQVIGADTFLPASEILAVVNADHWAVALPIAERHRFIAKFLVDKNLFPRDVLLQAIIDHLACE